MKVIAEAGVNHNGNIDTAIEMVKIASEAGADVIKFQTFNANKLASQFAPKANYQIKNTNQNESQLDMLRKLQLTHSEFKELKLLCEKTNIGFLSTAFDSESLDFLVNELGVETLKIPSGEITNLPFLLEHANTNKKIILSTGMSDVVEISRALGCIAFGYLSENSDKPSINLFNEVFSSPEGKRILKERLVLLHCTTEYPAHPESLNLNAIKSMQDTFDLTIGLSDHSEGVYAPLIASAMGAQVIEKHFTLDKNQSGPDHKASLNPPELKEMISLIKNTRKMYGTGEKKPHKSEKKNKDIARKSIVASSNINIGDVFTMQNLEFKRPGNGIPPYKIWEILGKTSTKIFSKDQLIEL